LVKKSDMDTDFDLGYQNLYLYDTKMHNKPLSVNISLFNYLIFFHFSLWILNSLIFKTKLIEKFSTWK